jgi:hypothetical protein
MLCDRGQQPSTAKYTLSILPGDAITSFREWSGDVWAVWDAALGRAQTAEFWPA